jgi:hypothetical protein
MAVRESGTAAVSTSKKGDKRRYLMKRKMARTALRIILFATLVALAPVAQAHGCSMSDVAGNYGYTSSGTIVTPPVGAFATVGHVTFGPTGNLSGAQKTSIAGNFFDETVSGTYSVNPDCTGTATVNIYHGTTLARTTNLNLVWDDNQKEVRAIFLTAGTVITIDAKKIFHEAED